MVYVSETLCTGCGECVDVCSPGAIRLVGSIAQIEQSLCQECDACLSACPSGAILAIEEPARVEKSVTVRAPAPVSEPASSRSGLWPVVGAALAFVGQEIVPRAAWALLDAWDRRQDRSKTISPRATGVTDRTSRSQGDSGRRTRWRGGRS